MLSPLKSYMAVTTQAIVLKSSPFDENGRIMTLLSEQLGICNALIRAIPPNRIDWVHASSPFFEGIYTLKKGRTDLYTFVDCSVTSYHQGLRTDYLKMKCGLDMLKAIHHFQIPQQPAPALYKLVSCFIKELSLSPNPLLLVIAFHFKLLRYEGIFNARYFCEGHPWDPVMIEKIATSLKFEEIYQAGSCLPEVEAVHQQLKHFIETLK